MSPHPERRGVLMNLAAEGVVPVLGGCAGALMGGPVGGLAGVAVGQAVEKAINFFGARIVERWGEWLRGQPAEVRQAALADLAALSPEEARRQADDLIGELAPDASPEDRSVAVEYLAAIPGTVDRALLGSAGAAARSLPPTVSLHEPQHLLQLLPTDVPPYRAPADLPGTPYRLEALLGTGGFGAVYRATARSLQHLPLAVKFCLDPALAEVLRRERDNLERLMAAGNRGWPAAVVRLYGYDLEHPTPYLVYEYVPGGDLAVYLSRRASPGQGLDPDECLELVRQITRALAFAHERGLVHRDLKPANVLVEGDALKLADFGLGGVAVVRAAHASRIGAATVDLLSVADQASLFRGAGTPLYMSPEQRRGAPPDPRHDLYSLGVMWFQLLVGDVSRELHPGWARELTVRHRVPQGHIDLIGRCVGWVEERPADAGALLRELEGLGDAAPVPHRQDEEPAAEGAPAPAPAPPSETGRRLRQNLLATLLKRLEWGHAEETRLRRSSAVLVWSAVVICLGGLFWLLVSLDRRKGPPVPLVVLGVTAACAVPWGVRVRWRANAHKVVADSLATLEAEFPDFVRSWGGALALRDAATFRGLRKLIPPGSEAASPPTDACQRSRQLLLASLVRRLGRAQSALARAGRPGDPWVWAGVIAILLVPVPFLAGAFTKLDDDIYQPLTWLAVLFVLGWAALFVVHRNEVAREVERCQALLAAEFPEEVRSWGGTVVLREPAAVKEIRATLEAEAARGERP